MRRGLEERQNDLDETRGDEIGVFAESLKVVVLRFYVRGV